MNSEHEVISECYILLEENKNVKHELTNSNKKSVHTKLRELSTPKATLGIVSLLIKWIEINCFLVPMLIIFCLTKTKKEYENNSSKPRVSLIIRRRMIMHLIW